MCLYTYDGFVHLRFVHVLVPVIVLLFAHMYVLETCRILTMRLPMTRPTGSM